MPHTALWEHDRLALILLGMEHAGCLSVVAVSATGRACVYCWLFVCPHTASFLHALVPAFLQSERFDARSSQVSVLMSRAFMSLLQSYESINRRVLWTFEPADWFSGNFFVWKLILSFSLFLKEYFWVEIPGTLSKYQISGFGMEGCIPSFFTSICHRPSSTP